VEEEDEEEGRKGTYTLSHRLPFSFQNISRKILLNIFSLSKGKTEGGKEGESR